MVRSLFVAAAVAAFVASGTVSAQKGSSSGSTTNQFLAAFQIAYEQAGGGQLLRARDEGGVFGFYFLNSNRTIEVEVSKDKLKVSKVKATAEGSSGGVSEDVLRLLGKPGKAKVKLPEGRLFEIAGQTLKNTPFSELKYEADGETLILSFGDLKLNAETGKPIEKK